MTTALDLVTYALIDSGRIGEGETPTADESASGLALLNQMLAVWRLDNVFVYAQQLTTFAPTGATSYTVGTGLDVDMIRPTSVDAIYWRLGTVDYPVRLLDSFEQYQSIALKTETGEPLYAFYLPSYTSGTLYLVPQPSTGTMRVISQVALPTTSVLADTLSLPPEYDLPIRTNLAVLMMGVYGAPVRQGVVAAAASSLRLLKRNNLRIEPLNLPGAIPQSKRPNILSGQ